MITLIQIKYMIAVEKHQSFIKASEECHVTQPTLSMQIKKAEEELGVSLFNRNTSPIQPTSIGIKVIEQGKRIIDEYGYIESIIHQEKSETGGSLSIGIIPTISAFLIPQLMQIIATSFPDLTIHFQELKTDDIITSLQKGTIEIGIMAGPFQSDQFNMQSIFKEPVFPYVNHKDVKGKFVDLEDLKKVRPWLLTEGNCFRTQMINLCAVDESIQNVKWKYQGGSIETLVRLVENFGGYTLLPGLATEQISLDDKFIKVFKSSNPLREVIALHRKRFAKSYLLDQIIQEVQKDLPPSYLKNEGELVEWQ